MAEWPLHGRDAELVHLVELLDDPASRGVVLTGAQGVGKTRLGVEILRIAAERGCAVERISATHATSSLPLGAVILPRPPQHAGVSSPAEATEVVHRVATDMIRRAAGRRLVVLVDDVHWLDQLSAVVIHQLAVTNTAFVVLTTRTGTTAPGPIVGLWKDDLVERVTINALAPPAVEELLTQVLGGPVAGATVAELADRSEGNVLFLREQILAALESGGLTCDAGVWRISSTSAPQPRLVELIEHRLRGLHPDARSLVEVIAFGEPLDLADAFKLSGEMLVENLEENGLIAIRSDGWGGATVLLAHPLIGEVLRAETSVIRARQITRMLAETAEQRAPTRPDDVLRIATWRLVCGGGSPELIVNAARTSFDRRDYELTVQFAESALAAGAGRDAQLLVAEAMGFTGRHDEADSYLADLQKECSSADDRAEIARARILQAYLRGDNALGERVYRDALQSIDDPWWRAEFTAKRGWLIVMDEGPRAGLRAVENLWPNPPDGSPLVATALTVAAACARSGQLAKAEAAALRGRDAQLSMTETFDFHVLIHEFWRCEALAMAGRISEWDALAQSSYAAAVRERSAFMQALYAYQRARAQLARGRVGAAARLAGETVGIGHQLNNGNFQILGLTTMVEALSLQGKVEAAGHALAELDSIRQTPWWIAETGIARAWLSIAKGDLVSACRTLEGEVEGALACDNLSTAALALHSLVRMGEARLAREPLHRLAERVEGELIPTQAHHADALVARDGDALITVAREFERIGAFLHAAEAYCDGAVVLRSIGNPKRSAALAKSGQRLLDRCEGAITPASQPVPIRTELTQAERRTAMLAARGRSNKDIATTEDVSVRTVESRLQSVYMKLGVTSRKDLAEKIGN
jgi:DNA-binding CsgD family transcriptional regulator